MRAIWTGSIAFGLVNVGVRVFGATEDHDVTLHQVHAADGGRIRYQRRCEVCGREVAYEHIDRAYADHDQTVVLTDDELSSLPTERNREIEVLEFVPSDQIDPIMLAKSYFLAPEERALKAYELLRRTLDETDRTAVVQFTLRRKTRLGALRTSGKVLILQGLLWDDEVREANFPDLDKSPRLSKAERDIAADLVESLSGDFTPDRFGDEYQEQLKTLVRAKLEQGESVDTEATFGEAGEDRAENVVDLMEALRTSVERSRQRKGGSGKGGTRGGGRKNRPKGGSSTKKKGSTSKRAG